MYTFWYFSVLYCINVSSAFESHYLHVSVICAQVERVEGFREASIRAMINKHRSAPAAAAASASSATKKAE